MLQENLEQSTTYKPLPNSCENLLDNELLNSGVVNLTLVVQTDKKKYIKTPENETNYENLGLDNQKDSQPVQTYDQFNLISPQRTKINLSPREIELVKYQDKLYEIFKQAGHSNWDNEGSDPVEKKTVSFALKIVGKILEKVSNPEITPDPSGRIDFDWHLDDGTMFTISVGNKKDLVISGLRYGISKFSGTQVWEGEDKNYSLLECGLDWFIEVQDG